MMKKHKKVLSAVLVAFLFLLGGNVYKRILPDSPRTFDVAGKLSLGNGPIKLVLFEDLLCQNCKKFTENVFPEIVSNYLETGKAEMSFIPVAFSERSKFFANAVVSVYYLSPGRFIPFLLDLSHSNATSSDDILNIASKVGGIPLAGLEKSIEKNQYSREIDQNLTWAEDVIGPEFGTPMLFVNGVRTSTQSFGAFEKQIHRLELH